MPPNVSKCVGDFSVVASSNSSLHGAGDFKVARNMELNAAAGTPTLSTTTQPLAIQSAQAMSLSTTAGNVSIAPGGTGAVQATAAAGGIALTTSSTGVVAFSSASNITSNAGGTQTHASVGDAALSSSTGVVAVTSTAGALTASGATAATLSSAAVAAVQAPTVNLGTTDSDAVNIGRATTAATTVDGVAVTLGNASSTITIPGNFVVSGTSTQVNTTQTTVSDNTLVLNQAPTVVGRDSGLIMKRHPTDVAADATPDFSPTLSANAAAAATSVDVLSPGMTAAGCVLKFTEAAATDIVVVTAVAGTTITFTPALANAYTSGGATLSVYCSQSNCFIYNEAADQFWLGRGVNAGDTDGVALAGYSTLRVKTLIADDMQTGSAATAELNIPDNAPSGSGVAIPNGKTRGSYSVIIESTAADGACGTFYLSKRAAADSAAAIFNQTSVFGTTDEQVSVEWPANSAPMVYHSTPKTGATGANLAYKVFATTVGV